METIDEIINESRDAREVKRAICIKMLEQGIKPEEIGKLLNVSIQWVSKWKIKYEEGGAEILKLTYKGKEKYLTQEEENKIVKWIINKEQIKIEELIEYIEKECQIIYKSKQSYYDLMDKAGMSYHKSEAVNPKTDMEKVLMKREEIKKNLLDNQEEIEKGEIVVLIEDESHLLWGDCCGYVWGKRNQQIKVEITNKKEKQTYYGAINLLTKDFHLKAFDSGNGKNTVEFIKHLQSIYEGKKLFIIWDNSSYHCFGDTQTFLSESNSKLPQKDWTITCIGFAPNCPQQNPVEDIWLKGKNFLRKNFFSNNSFAKVKSCFSSFLNSFSFDSSKFDWYFPHLI